MGECVVGVGLMPPRQTLPMQVQCLGLPGLAACGRTAVLVPALRTLMWGEEEACPENAGPLGTEQPAPVTAQLASEHSTGPHTAASAAPHSRQGKGNICFCDLKTQL